MMQRIASSAVALHNKIVKDNRSGFVSHRTAGRGQYSTDDSDADICFIDLNPAETFESQRDLVVVSDDIKVSAK